MIDNIERWHFDLVLILVLINVVALHWARLVLGWVNQTATTVIIKFKFFFFHLSSFLMFVYFVHCTVHF